ncbi:hypothetical protein [Mycobacterium sp.]|uniref:hypothetical protein n=1 Tax=Mycobacterium sp. TaxID=1785 RepID=UPI002C66142E|nr:hypothetical protein [Mycobacterium sp.]HME47175.1 hypothetical protein [Mycobacterium sp.]
MPQLATRGVEDTDPVDLGPHVPAAWYQRSPAAVVAGGLGIFLLAAIVFAVVTVANDSTRPPGVVPAPTMSLTPTTSFAPTTTPTPSPTDSPASPPPGDSPAPAPPTVTETASTENIPTEDPGPGWPFNGPRWRRLFPHLHLGGQ